MIKIHSVEKPEKQCNTDSGSIISIHFKITGMEHRFKIRYLLQRKNEEKVEQKCFQFFGMFIEIDTDVYCKINEKSVELGYNFSDNEQKEIALRALEMNRIRMVLNNF